MALQIFGHKSPDTDSTGSPIIWAWYLNEVKGIAAEPKLLANPTPKPNLCSNVGGLINPRCLETSLRTRRCDCGYQQP